jgi:hypothetical protein
VRSELATRPKIKRTNATWKEKYERLYHHYGRSIVTFKELREFGQITYDTTMAVTRLRRIPECRTSKKGVYSLNYVLDIHGIARVAAYDLKASEFIQSRELRASQEYNTIEESELDWLLTANPTLLEGGLTPMPEKLKRIRGVGEMDHFFRDASGGYVVVEVKRVKRYKNNREAVGQTVLYMGWVKKHMAKHGETVRGVLIVGKKIGRSDPVLDYAAEAIPRFEVRYWDSVLVPG